MMSDEKFRLITRSGFDGLVCAILLKELNMIDEIKFVHPKDMQDGKISISDRDISTNLPYVEGVHLAFDHHLSETVWLDKKSANHLINADAPSSARLVYDYYGGKKEFLNISDEMMDAVDKNDSAQFNKDEILNPTGWVLLNFIMDVRTGLGRYRDFQVSNYQLMMELIDYCRDHTTDEILALSDVKERVKFYVEQEEQAKEQIKKCAIIYENLIMLDLREEEIIYAGNRFLIYALFPETNISIYANWGINRLNTVFAVGKSILNPTSNTNVGSLMLQYSGGGHMNAGTCQVDNNISERVERELIDAILADG